MDDEHPGAASLIRARLMAVNSLILKEEAPDKIEYLWGKKDAYESALRDIDFCNDNH